VVLLSRTSRGAPLVELAGDSRRVQLDPERHELAVDPHALRLEHVRLEVPFQSIGRVLHRFPALREPVLLLLDRLRGRQQLADKERDALGLPIEVALDLGEQLGELVGQSHPSCARSSSSCSRIQSRTISIASVAS
jgi:hypothetical protein